MFFWGANERFNEFPWILEFFEDSLCKIFSFNIYFVCIRQNKGGKSANLLASLMQSWKYGRKDIFTIFFNGMDFKFNAIFVKKLWLTILASHIMQAS